MFPVDGEGRGAWEGLRKRKKRKKRTGTIKKNLFLFYGENRPT